jgi:type IX secretion system PorP/SprF family membrane protein
MKNRIVTGIFCLSLQIVFAQQIPQYSQYARNQYMLNPGATGVYDFFDANIGGRWQWAGFKNAPKTGYLALSAPLRTKSRPKYVPSIRTSNGIPRNPEINTGKFKHAVGGNVVADSYGAFQTLYLAGTYSIHLPVSKNYNLSFGTKVGISNNALLPEKARVLSNSVDYEYMSYFENGNTRNIVDVGAGLYFYSKKLFVGIAADHLTKDFMNFGHAYAYFERKMHFNLTAGYKFNLTEDWTLTPATLIKYMRPAPVSFEVTLLSEYKEFLWFGTSYRNKDAIVGMVGFNVNRKFKIGYSFDYSISRFNNYSSGGHELTLGLMLR